MQTSTQIKMSALPKHRFTEAEYLAFERASETKHEYFNGEIFDIVYEMPGGSSNHSLIASNVITMFNSQLKRRPCQVFTSDMRVRVNQLGKYVYPDVTVVCGKPEFSEDDNLLNPVLIAEVLSPSTEDYDRGTKFLHYRAIESLRTYILIAQNRSSVEVYNLYPDGSWRLTQATGLDQTLHLPSIECDLALSDVYDKTDLPAA